MAEAVRAAAAIRRDVSTAESAALAACRAKCLVSSPHLLLPCLDAVSGLALEKNDAAADEGITRTLTGVHAREVSSKEEGPFDEAGETWPPWRGAFWH